MTTLTSAAAATMSKRHLSVDDLPPTPPSKSRSVSPARQPDDGICSSPPEPKRPQSADNVMNACRRPENLGLGSAAVTSTDGLLRRRDRCSPLGCKRPMAITLPRLNFSLIHESSKWNRRSLTPVISSDNNISSSSLTPCASTINHVDGSSSGRLHQPCSSSCCSAQSDNLTGFSSCCSVPCSLSSVDPDIPPAGLGAAGGLARVQPTSIMPYLFLGSERDAFSEDVISKNGIKYVINVSTTSPKSPFVTDANFLRIPVNDGHSDRLLPFFRDTFQFLDAARKSSSCVLVHCLAGISRSPTLVIAYVMHHLRLSIDEAYRYVKERRPTISPNFNFLGQLVEYESQLQLQRGPPSPLPVPVLLAPAPAVSSCFQPPTSTDSDETQERAPSPVKRPCIIGLDSLMANGDRPSKLNGLGVFHQKQPLAVQSPTTALSKLQFDRVASCRRQSKFGSVRSPDADGFQPFPTPPVSAGLQPGQRFSSTSALRESSPLRTLSVQKVIIASDTVANDMKSHHQMCSVKETPIFLGSVPPVVSTPTAVAAINAGDFLPSLDSMTTNVEETLLWQRVQQACKSRSLEDILMLSAGDSIGSNNSSWKGSSDVVEDTENHGSMASLGSHGSLHGSLEVIQVS